MARKFLRVQMMLATLLLAYDVNTQEQTSPSSVENQSGSETNANRQGNKQTQTQIEPQNYEERIRSLERGVQRIEERLDRSPSWWLPIAVSAVLAAGLGFLCSRLAARRDRSIAAADRNFARNIYPRLRSSITAILETHGQEIKDAEGLVAKVVATPLLRPSIDDWSKFDETLWTQAITNLKLSPVDLTIPKEGNRYTRDLQKELAHYKTETHNLSVRLHEFSLMSRIRASFMQPDGNDLARYRENLLEEYSVKSVLDLLKSPAFQAHIKATEDGIDNAAKNVRQLNISLANRLKSISELIHDV